MFHVVILRGLQVSIDERQRNYAASSRIFKKKKKKKGGEGKKCSLFFKVCTRERNKKCCDSSVDDTVYIEYATRANTRIVVLVHANSRMQVQRTAVVGRVTVVARCSRISRPKTYVKLLEKRGTYKYISPLYSCIKSIFFEGNNALRRVKNFVDHVVSEATPFSPSQPYTLSRPPSGVCKLCAVLEPRLHSSVPHHQIFGCHENLEFLTRLFENSQLPPPLGLISFYTSCSSSSLPHFVCSFQDFKNCHAERRDANPCIAYEFKYSEIYPLSRLITLHRMER